MLLDTQAMKTVLLDVASLEAEQDLAASRGREQAFQEQLLKEINDSKERLKKQMHLCSEAEALQEQSCIHSCFAPSYQITNIKVIRNKQTGFSEGYGFVELNTHAMAEKALQTYSGSAMPNTEQPFRLNWASFSTGDKRADNGSDHSIFVGDLAADVTDNLLLETFSVKYPSVKAAKVVIDVNTGISKGYGFVRFGDDSERTQAMTEMNDVYCSSRPMRTGAATPRKFMNYQQAVIVEYDSAIESGKKANQVVHDMFWFKCVNKSNVSPLE